MSSGGKRRPLLVVGTYRTDGVTQRTRPPLLRGDRTAAAHRSHELEGLERDGVAQILTVDPGRGAQPHDGRRGARAVMATPSSPRRSRPREGGRAGRIPPRLQDLAPRKSALSAEASVVFRVAAVGGVRVDERLAADGARLAIAPSSRRRCESSWTTTSSNPTTTAPAMSSATHSRPRRCRGESLPGERSRLHASFAQALEQDPSLAQVGPALAALERARHWRLARTSSRPCPRGSRQRRRQHGLRPS